MTPITRPIFRLDVVGLMPIVIKIEPHADPSQVQVVTWTVDTAWGAVRDAERQAAEFEREADEAERDGRTWAVDASRAFAIERLTFATDLLVVLQGADHQRAAA
jgi:hypothetical protein